VPAPALLVLGLRLRGRLRGDLAALGRHQRVHQAQALEGVAGVLHLAVEDVVEVLLDVGAGQRRPAEDHRVVGGDPAGVHLQQVLLHDHGRLDQQPGHPDHVGGVLLRGVEDRVDRLLDAEVDHGVAVVGQDDVDEVLADVVDVALDRRQDDLALALLALDLLHVRLEVRDGGLHHLGALQHEGQLHLPEPNSSPTTFIPASRVSLTICSGLRPSAIAASRSASSRSSRRR
jgi:hypothetical protein